MVLALITASATGRAQGEVQDVLRRVSRYVAEYERAYSLLVADEVYTQVVRVHAVTTARRMLRSDVLQLRDRSGAWYGFRDVYEVDGQPVRNRDERLERLFVKPGRPALVDAQAVVAEGAAYNVGSVNRNINLPALALTYLRGDNQGRSDFTLQGRSRRSDIDIRELSFVEKELPAVVRTPDGALARGSIWVDLDGRVRRTELVIDSENVLATIVVVYDRRPETGDLLVPIKMDETYRVGPRETITGSANYGRFRTFTVDVAIR